MPRRRYPTKTVVDPTLGEVVNTMCRLVWEGRANQDVRTRAAELVRGLESGKYIQEAKAVLNQFSPPLFRYVKDPVGNEYLQGLDELHQSTQGDCDDISMGICAYLMALGHDCAFVLAAFSMGPPTHVFARMETPKGPMVLDPVAGPSTPRMLKEIRQFTVIPVEKGVDQDLLGGVLDGPFKGWSGWKS